MASDPFRLDGELALVTGGGTGLGYAMCRAMVDAGARVIATGRREEPLKQACASLGEKAAYVQHDITALDTITTLADDVERKHGPVSILVNNAGIHLKKSAAETSDEEFARVLQTHLSGSFAMSREFGKRMMERGNGSILMILSMAALFGIPLVPAYTAAKSALLGLTRALAVEMSPSGVRVNAICPGWIETDMSRGALNGDPKRKEKVLGRTPLGRMGASEDIGYAAVYLSSRAAKYVTGVALPVDGGTSIGF